MGKSFTDRLTAGQGDNMKLTRIILASVALLAVAGAAFGQGEKQRNQSKGGSSGDLSQYTVSAKAGAVNIAEGDIAYKRDQGDWDLLIAGDDLRSGDVVRTGLSGRAEILLNPGSYLRISENTEFVFTDTSLDNLKIELIRGSAIVEVAVAYGEKGAVASIITPQAEFRVMKGGIYRFDLDAAKTVALVRKGKLAVPQPDAQPTKDSEWVAVTNSQSRRMVVGTAIKEGKKIIIERGQTNILAVSKKEEDSFDAWSRDRAQALIAANKRLMNRGVIATALHRRMISRWDTGSGFWIYNPYSACYTFVPAWFGYSSPYGWGYGYCGCPNYYYPRNGGGWTGGGSGGWTGGGSTGGGSTGSKPGGTTGGSVGGYGDRGGSIGGIGTGRGGSASGRGNSGSRPLPPTP